MSNGLVSSIHRYVRADARTGATWWLDTDAVT